MKDKTNKLYEELLSQFGVSPQAVNWKNKEAQQIRFQQLAKIIKVSQPFSINDLGCGLGDFVTFLDESNLKFTYCGYDVSSVMIRTARQRYGDRKDLVFTLIDDPGTMQIADYNIGSGIFNLRFEETDEKWMDYILRTLTVMNEKSRLGFAANFLTKYSDKHLMRNDLYYADPCFIFDYCKNGFSKNVALLHDYNLYDFTILVRKD